MTSIRRRTSGFKSIHKYCTGHALEILQGRITIRILFGYRCVAHGVIWTVAGRLIAPVVLVEPYALEEVVLYGGPCCCLIQTTEFNIGRGASGHIEYIERGVRSRRFREETIVCNAGRQVLFQKTLRKVTACLYGEYVRSSSCKTVEDIQGTR